VTDLVGDLNAEAADKGECWLIVGSSAWQEDSFSIFEWKANKTLRQVENLTATKF